MSGCESGAQAPAHIHTYPEMNETIKDLLRRSEEPMNLYILARIEELEAQVTAAQGAVQRMEDMQDTTGYDLLTVQECLRLVRAAVQ